MEFLNKDRVEFRFSGKGGQGLVLASIIMAEALVKEGYNVIQGQSHGIEARGGASRGEVIASKGDIYNLSVILPDIFVTISQEACNKYYDQIKEDSLVLVDSFTVKEIPDFKTDKVYTIPFTKEVKEKLDTELATNIAFLGTLTNLLDFPKQAMKDSILDHVPVKSKEINIQAFELGIELGEEAIK